MNLVNPSRDRIGTTSLQEGLDFLKEETRHSHRIALFLSGQTTCVSCGVKGSYFYLERHKNESCTYSMQLYGINKYGDEVQMTLDHILPVALGGSDALVNAQCMCKKCNNKKRHFLEIKELISIARNKDAVEMNTLGLFPIGKYNKNTFKKQNPRLKVPSRSIKEILSWVKTEFNNLCQA